MNPKCNCNYCGADYACHNTNSTSSLWVHLRKCMKNPKRALYKKQKLLSFKKETGRASNLLVVTFNKVMCRIALAEFIMKDEQAFSVWRVKVLDSFYKNCNLCLLLRLEQPSLGMYITCIFERGLN